MRKILLGSAALVFLSAGSALATDLPVKGAVFKAPGLTSVDWTGWYIGAHAGYSWSAFRGTYDDAGGTSALDFRPSSFLGGAQLGYNWQAGRMVYGIEVDGSWTDLNKSRIDEEGDTQRYKTNFVSSARFRSGIAIDDVLLFSSIGLAYEKTKFSVVEGGVPASQNLNAFGLASGFGLEWVFAPNWSARAEYLYYGFNKRKNIPTLAAADSDPADFIKIDDVQVIRFALNYRPGASLKRTMAAPSANWAGGYIGAHAGYGRSQIVGEYDTGGSGASFDIDPKGFIGGGQLGWNWQNGAWVYGWELDGTWMGASKDRIDGDGENEKLKTSALASFRGRVGVSANDKLFYVTGGVGYVRSSLTVTGSDLPSPARQSLTSWGPVVGSGLEWAFAPNWNARLEGLTYLFSHRKALPTLTNDSEPADFIRQSTVNVIRVGLNYRY